MTIKTNTKYNFYEAEDDNFSWNEFFCSGGLLTHKPSGRQIYQMHWVDEDGHQAEEVTGEVRDQALAFWNELDALQKASEEAKWQRQLAEIEADPYIEPKHGENGYCRKCHSYCYGDCEANN